MKVKVKANYRDKVFEKDMTVGEIVEVDEERAEVLLKLNLVEKNKGSIKENTPPIKKTKKK